MSETTPGQAPSEPFWRPDQLLGARHDTPDQTGAVIEFEMLAAATPEPAATSTSTAVSPTAADGHEERHRHAARIDAGYAREIGDVDGDGTPDLLTWEGDEPGDGDNTEVAWGTVASYGSEPVTAATPPASKPPLASLPPAAGPPPSAPPADSMVTAIPLGREWVTKTSIEMYGVRVTAATLAVGPDGRTYSGPVSGAETVTEHLADCTDAKAAIVIDGSADDVIAQMTAAGWTLEERVDHVAGKRIRFLKAPAGVGQCPLCEAPLNRDGSCSRSCAGVGDG